MAIKQLTAFYRHPSFSDKNPKARAEEVHFGDGESSEVDPKTGLVELPIAFGDSTGWVRGKAGEQADDTKEQTEGEKLYSAKAPDVVAGIKKNDDKDALTKLAALEAENPKGARSSIVKAVADRLAELG